MTPQQHAKALEKALDNVERDGYRFRVDTDGRLYICTTDDTFETPGRVLARVVYETIPWDPDQFKE